MIDATTDHYQWLYEMNSFVEYRVDSTWARYDFLDGQREGRRNAARDYEKGIVATEQVVTDLFPNRNITVVYSDKTFNPTISWNTTMNSGYSDISKPVVGWMTFQVDQDGMEELVGKEVEVELELDVSSSTAMVKDFGRIEVDVGKLLVSYAAIVSGRYISSSYVKKYLFAFSGVLRDAAAGALVVRVDYRFKHSIKVNDAYDNFNVFCNLTIRGSIVQMAYRLLYGAREVEKLRRRRAQLESSGFELIG